MKNDDVIMVYMTAPDESEAMKIAEALVEDRVVACVNVLGAMQSVYRWQGKIERAGEVAMVAKTTREQFSRLEVLVKRLHSYVCPCIVAWPLSAGYPPFLDGVREEVG